MAGTIAPVIKHQFFTSAGLIASGYQLFVYEAGTTTKTTTYSDADLTVANTNPIVLDAAGRATIFLGAGNYKFVLATSTDTDPPTSPVWTVDEVSSLAALSSNQDVLGVAGENLAEGDTVYVSDGSGGATAGRWYKASSDQTYSSSSAYMIGIATAAILSGETGTIRVGGRVTGLSSLTAGTVYYVASSAGTLTATAPSNARAVGIADSTTSLLVLPSASVTSTAAGTTTSDLNLCPDAGMLIWAAGDAAAPSHYTLRGTTPTVARAGDGLADTNRQFGPMCAKITGAAGGAGALAVELLPTASFDTYWQGRPFSFGAWVKCSTASSARVQIYDGVGTSSSSYHTGAGDWEWLSVTRTLDAGATEMTVQVEIAASITGYASGFTALFGSSVPVRPAPSQATYGTLVVKRSGTVSVATSIDAFLASRPFLVKDVVLRAVTAPVGDDLIVDVNHWDGAADQSMYSTKPTIADGANYGEAQPDGTYRYRCFAGGQAAALTDALLSVDVDQVGSGTAGADLTVFVRCLQFIRPLESFMGYDE